MVPLVSLCVRLKPPCKPSVLASLAIPSQTSLGSVAGLTCPRKSDNCGKKPLKNLHKGGFFNGAASKNRTYDPVITNDVLYH